MEIWKDIEGYEGLYQVSNYGNIRSLNYRNKSQIHNLTLKVRKRDGYLTVGLTKNNRNKTFIVHRVVAKAFIPNPDNLPQVNHKDENKSNNNASNLEWCTCKYNIQYSVKLHPKRKTYYRKPNKWNKRVRQLDKKTGQVIREYSNFQEIGQVRGNPHTSAIVYCCLGKNKTAYGYKWEFCE